MLAFGAFASHIQVPQCKDGLVAAGVRERPVHPVRGSLRHQLDRLAQIGHRRHVLARLHERCSTQVQQPRQPLLQLGPRPRVAAVALGRCSGGSIPELERG
jgi:hypothetical protein